MGCADKMEECRSYIDGHLDMELSAVELAKRYHYSYYYFCKIFQISSGMSVASYIREKRLLLAAEKVKEGAGVLEAALDVGFETPSGFIKAFKKRFGCTPSEYVRKRDSKTGGLKMNSPKFVSSGPIYVLGHGCETDRKESNGAQAAAYWFHRPDGRDRKKHPHGHMGADTVKIGLWLKEPDEQGNLTYFFGEKVDTPQNDTECLSVITIPEAEYAVFTIEAVDMSAEDGHGAFAERIRETWKYIYEEWLEKSGCILDENGYDFEYYDTRCADKYASCMDIYIPVKK